MFFCHTNTLFPFRLNLFRLIVKNAQRPEIGYKLRVSDFEKLQSPTESIQEADNDPDLPFHAIPFPGSKIRLADQFIGCDDKDLGFLQAYHQARVAHIKSKNEQVNGGDPFFVNSRMHAITHPFEDIKAELEMLDLADELPTDFSFRAVGLTFSKQKCAKTKSWCYENFKNF